MGKNVYSYSEYKTLDEFNKVFKRGDLVSFYWIDGRRKYKFIGLMKGVFRCGFSNDIKMNFYYIFRNSIKEKNRTDANFAHIVYVENDPTYLRKGTKKEKKHLLKIIKKIMTKGVDKNEKDI